MAEWLRDHEASSTTQSSNVHLNTPRINFHRHTQDTWDRLLKQTEAFAAQEAAVRWWRGAHDGVLPGGYDPGAIAAQAVSDLFQSGDPPVTRLRRWKENYLLRNEPDLATVLNDAGEPVRIIDPISREKTVRIFC